MIQRSGLFNFVIPRGVVRAAPVQAFGKIERDRPNLDDAKAPLTLRADEDVSQLGSRSGGYFCRTDGTFRLIHGSRMFKFQFGLDFPKRRS